MQRTTLRLACILTLIVHGASVAGCGSFHDVKRELRSPEEFRALTASQSRKLADDSPYLKAHMRGGNVYVLSKWSAHAGVVTGTGILFGPARNQLDAGVFTLGADSVAIFETNVVTTSAVAGILTVATVLTVAVAIYCLTNEKACFGSCPTFYVTGADSLRPRAEGFSASIAPSLEASDIDDLRLAARGGDSVDITMRNEAYETHFVRRADMLAVPRPAGHRVLADNDRRFWSARELVAPVAAHGPEGGCLDLLARADGRERFSEADSTDLRASEFVEVEFARPVDGAAGIVVDCRQTLLTTYLLYQTFAYMGAEAGHWLAELERGNIAIGAGFATDYVGCIGVQAADSSGQFVDVGSVCEYGPIARDRHVIPLDPSLRGTTRVRLVMTRGNWRIDQVALAALEGPVEPVLVRPSRVQRAGQEDAAALDALLDSTRTLVTLPGDSYTMRYSLPGTGEYDLFLDAQGYYLEWIRREWMKEENPAALAEMFLAPDQAMKRLAPEFKRMESSMESTFWSSKYERR